jgi:hypothetical protein
MKEGPNDVASLRGHLFRRRCNIADLLPQFVERCEPSVQRRGVATAWYVVPVSSEVDVTLVQETLALTPQQRIQQNDRVLRMIEELRDGVAKSRKPARDASKERR